jgi:hypothetical protein
VSRGPYIIAGAIAGVPLLILAAAAPGGHDWVWLEYPRRITFVAIVLGIACCFARKRQLALLVPFATAAVAVLWEMLEEYVGLSKFGRTDLFHTEIDLMLDESMLRPAPWLMGGLYGVLAFLSIARSRSERANRVRAGVWLAAVGGIAIALTMANESWLTLENLGGNGTFRSSVAWPDTKKLELVASALACATGLVAALYRKREDPPLPRATLRE